MPKKTEPAVTPLMIESVIDLIDRETSMFAEDESICPPRIIALRKFAKSLKGN